QRWGWEDGIPWVFRFMLSESKYGDKKKRLA
ncbi:hypothetical protein AVEN_120538-1, partial [Araneus ventricosus]